MTFIDQELLPEVFSPEQARDDIVTMASDLITYVQKQQEQKQYQMGRLRTETLETGDGVIFSYGEGVNEPSRSIILAIKGAAIELHDYHFVPDGVHDYVMQKRMSVVSKGGDHHSPGQTVYKKDLKAADPTTEEPLAPFTLQELHALVHAIDDEKDMPIPEQPKRVTMRDHLDNIGRIVLAK